MNTKGIPIDSIDPKYGQTALMYACRRGHITTVTKLLDLGASVNVRSARETTAFLEAYLQHSETCNQVAKLLLAREDLDVNVPYINDYGRTALMIAARSGDEEVVDLLLQRPDLIRTTKTKRATLRFLYTRKVGSPSSYLVIRVSMLIYPTILAALL